jgi:hypothetical protein
MLEGALCIQGIKQKTQKGLEVLALSVTLEQTRKRKNCVIEAVTSEG